MSKWSIGQKLSLVLVAGIGVAFVWVIALAVTARDPLRAQEDALRKAGIPTTNAEIYAMAPKAGTDAAPYYKRYTDRLDKEARKRSDIYEAFNRFHTSFGLTPPEKDRLGLKIKPLLNDVIEGSKAGHWNLMSPTGRYNTGTKDTAWSVWGSLALAEARRGRYDDALEALRTQVRIGKQMGQNPYMFAKTRQLSSQVWPVLKVLNQILQVDHGNPVHLQEGIDFINELPPQPDIRQALTMECANFFVDFKDAETISGWHPYEQTEFSEKDKVLDKVWYGPRVRKWWAMELQIRREAVEQLPQGQIDWEVAHDSFQQAYDRHKKDLHPFGSGPFADLVFYDIDYWGRNLAFRRALLTAIRIQMTRVKTGKLPTSLPDYREDSIDPFTHKPLIYRVTGDHFVVYSVGQNRIDDGGDTTIQNATNKDLIASF